MSVRLDAVLGFNRAVQDPYLAIAHRFKGWPVVITHMASPDLPLRTVVIAMFTVIETAALAIWLRFVRGRTYWSYGRCDRARGARGWTDRRTSAHGRGSQRN